MINIPIWPGSSSFTTQMTPFGFFDTDIQFVNDIDKVAQWCATRLGYPLVAIELQDINFYAAFEEAIIEYSNQVNQYNIRHNLLYVQGTTSSIDLTQKVINQNLGNIISISENYGTEAGSGGNVDWKRGSINVIKGQQQYDLQSLWGSISESNNRIEIKKIYHDTPPAIVRYFDPYLGTGASSMGMLDQFEWGKYSPASSFLMMPINFDLIRIQHIEFNDQIRKSAYSFQIVNNKVKLFPIPTFNYTMYFEYIVKNERNNPIKQYDSNGKYVSDYSNINYNIISYGEVNAVGKSWIWQYTLALCKEMLGLIRGKYSTIPFSGQEQVTLNGQELITQGREEKEKLVTILRENLDSLSPKQMILNEADKTAAVQNTLKSIPLKIYIG